MPGEPFTVSANVSNSSAYNVSNVPVKFYRDTILLDSAVIPAVNAFGNSTITKVFSFPTDGFYPIKVWIDSSNTLGESNILNNYAIRPINVGNVVLPGGINATTTALLQSCPQKILISGNAQYFGTASPTVTAGAEVKIRLQVKHLPPTPMLAVTLNISGRRLPAVLLYTIPLVLQTLLSPVAR